MHFNLFLDAHPILIHPSRETLTAGLGNVYQYGFVLLALIIIGIISWIRRKRKKAEDKRKTRSLK